jgi:hypothetical protein
MRYRLGLTVLLATLVIQPGTRQGAARTADPKPWHVLQPITCCFDNNTGTAAFVESYATKQECLTAALRLARKLTPANCHAAACASEVWCIDVDESVNGLR